MAPLRAPWDLFKSEAYGERCLFHPRESIDTIAYVREGKFGDSLYQRSYGGGFQKFRDFAYSQEDDYLLGAAAWSSSGKYFGVGTFSYGGPGDRRTYTVWDVSDATVVTKHELLGTTEHGQANWHRERDLVFVHHSHGGTVIDARTRTGFDLTEVEEGLTHFLNATWHPVNPVLLCAG